ncbi:MAG: carboxypeptidase-like regulatory domain-containing protein [Bacteroidetes bacterium]|nr:carboxypeptidase-like regulatory domain-containing protein [Bacteroidota bacterium]
MKLIIILICILGLTGSYASVYSQQTKLDLNVKKMAVKDVLKLIEDQSEFSFMYNASKIDVYRKIDLNVEKSSVEDVLKKIFPGEDFFYKIIDRNIIISVSSEANGTESGQQQKTVTGKVTDSSGIPLPGVTVVLKGTTTGIITDANGNYSLSNIPANASLKFSFIGMKSQEVEVGGKTTVNVKMDEETIGIEEVVAIGYGTIGKKEVSSSIVSVNKEDFIQTAVSSPMELVTGKIAGLNVNSTETANPNSIPRLKFLPFASNQGCNFSFRR